MGGSQNYNHILASTAGFELKMARRILTLVIFLGNHLFGRGMASSVSASSPLDFFPLDDSKDAMLITWAHAVNSLDKLDGALKGDYKMLEADILLHGQGTVNQTNTPIMAHPPDIYSDLTLDQWLRKVITTSRGMKLDFKSNEVLEPSMRILAGMRESIKQPVWINADILRGPNTANAGKSGSILKKAVSEHFPDCTLSVGWTTGDGEEGYTRAMVDEMLAFLSDVPQPVTFPIRASLAYKSWSNLSKLLEGSPSYTITLWSNDAQIDPKGLVYIRDNSDVSKIYYDLPDELMDSFKKEIAATSGSSRRHFPWKSACVFAMCAIGIAFSIGGGI